MLVFFADLGSVWFEDVSTKGTRRDAETQRKKEELG